MSEEIKKPEIQSEPKPEVKPTELEQYRKEIAEIKTLLTKSKNDKVTEELAKVRAERQALELAIEIQKETAILAKLKKEANLEGVIPNENNSSLDEEKEIDNYILPEAQEKKDK